jgi:adenylate cyclase class IV
MTYKGPGKTIDGVHARREIEFTVGDFHSAQLLLIPGLPGQPDV